MKKTIVSCLAVAVLLTGCAQSQEQVTAKQQEQWDQERLHRAQMAQQGQRDTTQASPQAQAQEDFLSARDQYAREYCANQAAMANMSQHGLINAAFAGLGMQASCIDFYNRTGEFPQIIRDAICNGHLHIHIDLAKDLDGHVQHDVMA